MNRTALRLLLLISVLPALSGAAVTPFGRRVNQSIDRALGNLRATEANGNIGGRATGLAVLCFLEKRESADWGAPHVGYAGMDAADQALVRRAVAYMINNDAALRAGGLGYTYQTGSSLMGIARYLDTGGPDGVGAQVGARQALVNGVAAMSRQQNPLGGWNYDDPEADNDLSTTQFALAGLAAASAVVPVDRNVINRAAGSTDGNHAGGGCYNYRTSGWAGCSSSMTASALWVQRLGDRPLAHANVQRAMVWLRDNWRYDGHIAAPQAAWGVNSYYYYLWAAAKGLEVAEAQDPNLVTATDVGGARDPRADGFPEEPQGWYYDMAWSLTERQNQNGTWPSGGNRSSWDGVDGQVSSTSFATLVLLRSLGGVCIDADGDRVEFGGDAGECLEDNCPDVPNPDQADGDGDGVGDACDPCVPGPEVCNGEDDDCDDAVDEDIAPRACQAEAEGACAAGHTVCVEGVESCVADGEPGLETCNGIDDDCDGEIDEGDPEGGRDCDTGAEGQCAFGRTACVDGAVACEAIDQPANEVCDGLDNDCDGQVDEGLNLGEACDTGQPGVCGPGHLVCAGGAVVCGPEAAASPEVCDGLDNDCDGVVDDDVADAGEDCATGLPGECRRGLRVCVDGQLDCLPGEGEMAEVCNLLDDDCDGVIDEEQRNACGQCGADLDEVCDGQDQDCDGETDEDAPCPRDQICRWGRCADPCLNNECSGNEVCIEGLCAEPCDLVECQPGRACRPDGQCVDPCEGVDCGGGEVCVDGECVENQCHATGCPDGEVCVDFACVPDPCFERFCNEGEFCREGACVESCADVSCPFGEACIDGACVAHDCADVECEGALVCVAGECLDDACDGVECLDGQACIEGDCGPDPCLHVECPPAERCVVVDGLAQCAPAWGEEQPPPATEPDAGTEGGPDAGPGVDFDGGNGSIDRLPPPDGGVDAAVKTGGTDPGCTCDTTPASAGPWLLSLLLLGLRRRRR